MVGRTTSYSAAVLNLTRASFAMTEQPRTISRHRITRHGGRTDEETMHTITLWIKDLLAL